MFCARLRDHCIGDADELAVCDSGTVSVVVFEGIFSTLENDPLRRDMNAIAADKADNDVRRHVICRGGGWHVSNRVRTEQQKWESDYKYIEREIAGKKRLIRNNV